MLLQRIHNQQLLATRFTKPQEIVSWMGAMQAQEYAMAKWAIGLRLPGSTDATIEKAFNNGKILRTHLLRPTWHFVSPKDIHWILALTAPHILKLNAYMNRQCNLDAKTFGKSNVVIATALEQRGQLTREELMIELAKSKIKGNGIRLGLLMMHAELEGIICSGAKRGNQFTYDLLDNLADRQAPIPRQEALAKLADRYYSSRGPATIHDFATWSGLSIKDSMLGTQCLGSKFVKETISGKDYFFKPIRTDLSAAVLPTFLMPDYDELGMGYKDRSALVPADRPKVQPLYNRMLVVDGTIQGSWKRVLKGKGIEVKIVPFKKMTNEQSTNVKAAIERFKKFVLP